MYLNYDFRFIKKQLFLIILNFIIELFLNYYINDIYNFILIIINYYLKII